MSSLINDENGQMEPYADLPAMALALVGFIIFIALMAQAYTTYQQKTFIAEHYQDAANLAEKLSRDGMLTSSTRSDIISASKFDDLNKKPDDLIKKYGAYYNFMVKVEVNSEDKKYNQIIKKQGVSDPKFGVSASIPVTVKLNDVQELPGTLTVKIWRK